MHPVITWTHAGVVATNWQRLRMRIKGHLQIKMTMGCHHLLFFVAQRACNKKIAHKPRIYHLKVCRPLHTTFAQSMNLRNQGHTYLSIFLRVLRATLPTPRSNIMFCSKRTLEPGTACHKGRIDPVSHPWDCVLWQGPSDRTSYVQGFIHSPPVTALAVWNSCIPPRCVCERYFDSKSCNFSQIVKEPSCEIFWTPIFAFFAFRYAGVCPSPGWATLAIMWDLQSTPSTIPIDKTIEDFIVQPSSPGKRRKIGLNVACGGKPDTVRPPPLAPLTNIVRALCRSGQSVGLAKRFRFGIPKDIRGSDVSRWKRRWIPVAQWFKGICTPLTNANLGLSNLTRHD